MTRSEQWNTSHYFPLTVLNPDKNPQLAQALKACPGADDVDLNENLEGMFGQAKEMVLLVNGDQIDLQAITFSLDAATGHLVLARSWQTVDLDKDELLRVLAIATLFDVPVYPDRDEDLPILTDLWSRLRSEGVQMTHDGKKVRVRWTREPFASFDSDNNEWVVRPTVTQYPGDVGLLMQKIRERESQVSEAMRIVANLRESISGLRQLLSKNARDENALQRFLTAHPLLFGLQYKRVIPKYRLGGTYELDYALEAPSGLVDLVEIEASTHKLFTKSGNPTAALIHAEQQVLDWLDWVDTNMRLVRDDLPGAIRPVGQVVIGSRTSLSDQDRSRLSRRNVTWQGSVQVLTFEDLLDRADSILNVLGSAGSAISNSAATGAGTNRTGTAKAATRMAARKKTAAKRS